MGNWNDLVVKSEFTAAAEHTEGLNASQLTLGDLHAAFLFRLSVKRSRDVALVEGHRYVCAFKYVRRAGYDLNKPVLAFACRFRISNVDAAYDQLVCIRVLFDDFYPADNDLLQVLAEVFASFEIRSRHDHLFAEFLCRNILKIYIIIYPFNWY